MDAYGHRSYNFTAHNTQAYLASEMASNASNASFFQSKVEPVVKFKAMSHLNTIAGPWYFGRVYLPLRLKNQSLYHKILILQKFNDK